MTDETVFNVSFVRPHACEHVSTAVFFSLHVQSHKTIL